MASRIENLIHQLEPKFLTRLQEYLEYLLSVQKNKQRVEKTSDTNEDKATTLSTLKKFKGDAPFPNITISKSDIYEQ